MTFLALRALRVERYDDQLAFLLPNGRPIALGVFRYYVPKLIAALEDRAARPSVIAGVAVGYITAFSDVQIELLGGPLPAGFALVWRNHHGDVLQRTDLSHDDVTALRAWLAALPVPPPPREMTWRESRDDLLAMIAELVTIRQQAEREGASSDEISTRNHSILELRREYADELPPVPLTRDPLTGDVLSVRMDLAGLDGLYWDAMAPARPFEPQPPSYVVHSGAMALDLEAVEDTLHLCAPGPAVPYVVPALLSREGVGATLSQVGVGPHTGYVISYFANADQPQPLTNEWGSNRYWLRAGGEPTQFAEAYDTWPAPDFELGPWLRSGKLLWVTPGDAEFRLHEGVEGCPYLGLPGRREHQRVQLGKVW